MTALPTARSLQLSRPRNILQSLFEAPLASALLWGLKKMEQKDGEIGALTRSGTQAGENQKNSACCVVNFKKDGEKRGSRTMSLASEISKLPLERDV